MPENYKRHPEAGDLPEKAKVWLVQNSGKKYSGAVSMGYNFEGGPDDESLVAGCNGKNYPHTAVGRHGNFLQWGYGEPPSKMTEDGRTLFLNCICYIRKFAGQAPLVRNHAMNRRCAFHYKAFSPDLAKEYEGREDELYQLCKDNIELLRYEQKQVSANVFEFMFPIDFELKELGIASNRRIDTLEKLIALLAPSQAAPQTKPGFFERLKAKRTNQKRIKTARRLLTRYTGLDLKTHEQWRRWLDEHRDRTFFSDFGGYKFYVRPQGYPAASAPNAGGEPFWFPR